MRERDTSYSGWVIVGVSFITLALAYGVWYSFSVFFVALLKEYDWSRSILAGAFSLFIIIHGLAGSFVGGMVDRLGPRRVILLGSLFLGIGLTLCSLTQTWWQFYIFFGVITAVGIGAIGWVPNVTLIQHWFREKRGLAIGIISSGIGIGILVCIPTIQYLIIQFGWRITYGIMAITFPVIIISMAIILLKRPVQVTSSYQIETKVSHRVAKDPLIVNEAWASTSWTLKQAIATRQFWLLGASFFLGSLITQSIFAHQVAFFVDRGLNPLLASYIAGIVGVVSLGGKILWGTLSDRIGREITYAMGITCYIFGVITLVVLNISPSSLLSYLFAFFFGMGYSVTAALPPLMTADLFGGYAFGGIFGSIMVFTGVGGAFGAWFTGFIFDLTGSYVPAFVVLILCALFACFNIWAAAPSKIRRVPGSIRNNDRRIG
jgi:MFS family permease